MIFLILLESTNEQIDFEEKKEIFVDFDKSENIMQYQTDIYKNFGSLEIENFGKDLENEMNNLNINPKKRRLDCTPDQFQLKKIH